MLDPKKNQKNKRISPQYFSKNPAEIYKSLSLYSLRRICDRDHFVARNAALADRKNSAHAHNTFRSRTYTRSSISAYEYDCGENLQKNRT